MEANEFAQRCASAGLQVLRVSERSITVRNKNNVKKCVRFSSIKNVESYINNLKKLDEQIKTKRKKSELNWNLIGCVVVICCGIFICAQIKSHTQRIEKIQNEMEFERLVYKLESGRRMK